MFCFVCLFFAIVFAEFPESELSIKNTTTEREDYSRLGRNLFVLSELAYMMPCHKIKTV